MRKSIIILHFKKKKEIKQGWNDLNQLIKISDLNRDLNKMIFLSKKSFDLNPKFD